MFLLEGLIGYFLGTFVTLMVMYFGYRIGEMNKEDEEISRWKMKWSS
ncbi:hypothetical protein [Bacillus pseudomycoides]